MKSNVSAEEFSTVVAAIHAAGASPERWPEAVIAVAQLVPASDQDRFALASLDRLAIAAFIVDVEGVVHDLNASAFALLQSGGPVQLAGRSLGFSSSTFRAAFYEALCKATVPPVSSSTLPLFIGARGTCDVALSPYTRESAQLPSETPFALVVIAPPRAAEMGMVQRMRSRYRLTDAEARVISALAAGATVSQIASKHGVRASTVRAQVRSLFEKTGVHRQSDLVRLALTSETPALREPAVRDVAVRGPRLSLVARPQR